MKTMASLFFLLFSIVGHAQNMNQAVEEYIRKNKVPVVQGSDDAYVKGNLPYIRVDAKRKIRTLSVPHGAIPVGIPTGEKCVREKFHSFNASSDLICTVYIVQHIQNRDSICAFDGGAVKKGYRTRVDLIVDYSDEKKPNLACYFLYGAIFNAPFLLPTDRTVKIKPFSLAQDVIGKDIPALLIYNEDVNKKSQESLIDQFLKDKNSLNTKRSNRFYKQLGDYCIVYYKMQKNEK